ncbi:MAG: 30S ribosomal protein S9 [Anaerolineae bacterium]|nr:30S ribosomal protein S9 [Anaerolineae bacterium]
MAEQAYHFGTGRRKTSSARVRLYPGQGTVVVNGKSGQEYFPREGDIATLLEPLVTTNMRDSFDVVVKVVGGGITGQVDAVRHGIARALLAFDPDLRPVLRKGGYLTRDAREKERKKAGLKRARKAPQYTKR